MNCWKNEMSITDSPSAEGDMLRLRKPGGKIAGNRLSQILDELRERPDTGFGKPEPLKYRKRDYWSRQITVKHRLVYQIREEEITVLIVQAFGRYMDK